MLVKKLEKFSIVEKLNEAINFGSVDKISWYVCLIKSNLAVLSFNTTFQYLNHVAKKQIKKSFWQPFVL